LSDKTLVLNKSGARIPSFPLLRIKELILGKKYELSVAYLGKAEAKALNKKYRNKDYIPNVLSFALTKSSGELIICPEVAKKQSKEFAHSYSKTMILLVIHGMLHLEGYVHGSKMDEAQKSYEQKISLWN